MFKVFLIHRLTVKHKCGENTRDDKEATNKLIQTISIYLQQRILKIQVLKDTTTSPTTSGSRFNMLNIFPIVSSYTSNSACLLSVIFSASFFDFGTKF